MKKRLLSLLLAVVLVAGLLPGISLTAMAADGPVIEVNETPYSEIGAGLTAAATAAENNGTVAIKLLADVERGSYSINLGSWTIDLNGHTWTTTYREVLDIYGTAQVTITDSSTNKTGKMVGIADYPTIDLHGEATLEVVSGTIEQPQGYGNEAIAVHDAATLTMSGGALSVQDAEDAHSIFLYNNLDNGRNGDAEVILTGGTYSHPIRYYGGTLTIASALTGLQIHHHRLSHRDAEVGEDIILPAGYVLFNKDGHIVETTKRDAVYTIGAVTASYGITVTYGEHGVASAPANALAWSTVPVTTTPEDGYMVKSITVTDANGNNIDVNRGSFLMPETAVSVHVTFEKGDVLRLKLADSEGDGWTGNAVRAMLWNGESKVLLGDYTIEDKDENTDYSAEFDLEVPEGCSLLLYWIKGEYASECSITLQKGSETLYQVVAPKLINVPTDTLLYGVEPGVSPYGLELCGEPVMPDKLSGEGWRYDPETNTLTLNNYHGATDEEDVEVIHAEGDLTIVLEGENTVSATGSYDMDFGTDGIHVEGSLTIKGTGSLDITATEDGLNAGEITINSGNLTINSEDGGIDCEEDLTVHGGTITITSGDEGFDVDGTAVIRDGKITITSESDGIDAAGHLAINGGEITINAESAGLECGTAEKPCTLAINGGIIDLTTDGEGDPALLVYGEIALDEDVRLPRDCEIGIYTIAEDDGTGYTFTTALKHSGEPCYTLKIGGAEKSGGLLDLLIINGLLGTKKADFDDVHKDDYFYQAVNWAVGAGVTNGMDETTFGADLACTRAQAVTFLWRAAGSPTPRSSKMPFTDVAKGSYYYDAVLWAVEQGITNGMTATTFGIHAPCTRAQIVTFLWRAQGSPAAAAKIGFADVAGNAYYADAVRWAVAEGITNGMTATTFGSGSNCTRAQIVTFLYRCMK